MPFTPGTIDYDIVSEWNAGFVAEVGFVPEELVDGWRVELTFDGDIVNIWNARIVSRDGNTYVLENMDYNAAVGGGQTVSFGFQASGTDTTLEFSAGPIEPPVVPDVFVGDASVLEGDPSDDPLPAPDNSVMGVLSTSGNQILGADGRPVTIEAVNWFGMETTTFTPHGLWTRNWQEMMDEMKALGFNAIRLPFSLQAVLDGGVDVNSIDYSQNPDLQGLNSLEILDKIVGYAEEIEIGILLDNHRSAAGNGPNPNGLWFDGGYTEADWIDAWQMLAERYGDSPAIIGADLVNEPHGASWNDWAAAAERAGNAILAETENWLIVVEGVGSYEGDPYWWGGSLKGVADRPVELNVDGKLVYSPHDYPASVFPQPWFFDGTDLTEKFREQWGFIHEEGIAPIFLGEFGSRLETDVDRAWADAIVKYLSGDYDANGTLDPGSSPMSFAWWSWNPNSGDTGGILQDDWRTVREDAIAVLEPLLDGPTGGEASGTTITFDITLSEATSEPIEVAFTTRDGSATAGEDYVAQSGTVTFAPGDTVQTVEVEVLPDNVAEGDEAFLFEVTGPNGAALSTGTIIDDDGPPPPPPP
ncbi:MAG: cellulase family glycosylhydrolase, partial [Pseudomonadota bacterium]